MAKPDHHLASNNRVLALAALLYGMVALALVGLNSLLGSHNLQRGLDQVPWFGIMHVFTGFGDGLMAIPVTGWLVLRRSSRSEWIAFLVGFALAAMLPQMAKNLIWPELPRPFAVVEGLRHSPYLKPALWKSFPSGHSATAAYFSLFLAYRRPQWSLLLFALGAAVGLSRVALHYHWVEDVVAGWAVGLCSAWLAERTLGPKLTTHGIT